MKTASLVEIRACTSLGLSSVIFGHCVPPPTLWSSYVLADLCREARLPHYCVVQVNNVIRNPDPSGGPDRHLAFPQPHVVFQYYEGHTGRWAYALAEPIRQVKEKRYESR